MKQILLLLLFLFPIISFSQTFYISPSGNDAANGSISAPWKTLLKATQTVTTGVIKVAAGTYTETKECYLAKGVSIEGDGYNTTIINSTLAGTWSTFLTLQSPDGTAISQHISGVTLDGGYTNTTEKTWVGIWVTGRGNVHIYNCRIRNFKQSATIFNGNSTNTNPDTDVNQNFAFNNKFYNNIVTNCAAMYNGTGQGALMIGFQSGMEIYGNDISQTQRPNFQNGWPIKYWNQGWLRGTKIYNNTLTKIPYSGNAPGENGNWDFCIEFFNASGTEIYNNKIQGAIDLAYNYKGNYAYSVWIHDNDLTHVVQGTKVEGAIILEYRSESVIIEDNIIKNKTYGISFNTRAYNENGDDRYYITPTPVGGYSYISDCIIRRNLFTGIYTGQGMGNRFGIGVIHDNSNVNDPQIKNLKIYHNTIIGSNYIGMDFTSMENGKGTGIEIWDNIVVGFTDSWLRGSSPNPGISQISIRNNIAWNNGAGNVPVFPTKPTSYTFTQNLIADPKLDANYLPTSGSPAIGMATDGGNIGYGTGSTPPPSSPCVYTYSSWSTCVNGSQTRTVTSALPNGCTGTPILTQNCITPPTPTADTIYCSIIIYLPTSGNVATKRNLTYFVKRSDGFYYDSTGAKVDIILYKHGSKWYPL